jgi:hypothetical protein
MDQRVSLITLGVSDLARSRAFYDSLGWRGQEVEETVFFQAGGMAVVLWGREKLAEDAGLASSDGQGFPGVVLAHNVRSRAEVDDVLDIARRGGAAVLKPAAETFYGGYAGHFSDPDGHLWEIAHNPGFHLEADGSLVLPDFSTGDTSETVT